MASQRVGFSALLFFALVASMAVSSSIALGQANNANNNNNNGNNNNNNNNNNNGGGGGGSVAGVEVDAQGVLRMKMVADPTGRLQREAMMAAKAKLKPELARASDRRYISLNRLEAAIREKLNNNQPISDDMKYLAGLTRLKNVFYFPESKDIIISGTAEGFALDASGRAVGVITGRSVLELQDLLVALRAFPQSGKSANLISVSIDPTQEGLNRMQQFLGTLRGITPNDDVRIATGLRDSLGLQKVTIMGISPQTHFAQVMVEADYRMKLIGIGLENPPAKIPSYVAIANPSDVSRNAMERWYFTPNYECIRASEDGTAMEMVGEGVKLIGENERVTAEGGRVSSGQVNVASQKFCKQFTANYPELARNSPVYAQLRNLIDMSIASAWIQKQDFYGQAGWKMETFGDESALPTETYTTPKQVETAVNIVWRKNKLMTPIGGGVHIQPRNALATANIMADEGHKVADSKKKVKLEGLIKGQWWWD